MIGRIKSYLRNSSNEVTKSLRKLGVDHTHAPISFKTILDSFNSVDQQRKSGLLDQLYQGIQSTEWIFQLKCYLVLHYLITRTQRPELGDRLVLMDLKGSRECKEQDVSQWIRTNIIREYHIYIMKLCVNFDVFLSCKQNKLQGMVDNPFMQEVNISFRALNLTVGIMKMQTTFSRMGRYYPEYAVMLDLYKLYLGDVRVFYSRIKYGISFVLLEYLRLNDEEITHAFYFLNEALENSDRQYQFFYNRYYHKRMKDFNYPSFFKLDYSKYSKLLKHIAHRGLNVQAPYVLKNRQKERGAHNKTIGHSEATTVSVQDHGKTCNYSPGYGQSVLDTIYL